MLGLLFAFGSIVLAQITGNPIYDGIASVLIGESANRQVVDGIRRILNTEQTIQRTNEILTMHMGPDFILANISVDFRDDILAGEIEKTIASLDQKIKSRFSDVRRIFIEAESQLNRKA